MSIILEPKTRMLWVHSCIIGGELVTHYVEGELSEEDWNLFNLGLPNTQLTRIDFEVETGIVKNIHDAKHYDDLLFVACKNRKGRLKSIEVGEKLPKNFAF